MHRRRILLMPIVLLLAACSAVGGQRSVVPAPTDGVTSGTPPSASGTPATASGTPATASGTPPASAAASPSAPAIRVEIELTDALRIEPGPIVVPAGVPVTFVVTNVGTVDHEFYLGDEAAQLAHGQEMLESGGMSHDEPEGIGVEPGETKELVTTFMRPGTTLAGCHIVGHYEGGMKTTITVVES